MLTRLEQISELDQDVSLIIWEGPVDMQHQILAGIGGIVAIFAIAIIIEALGKGLLTVMRQRWLKK